SLITIRCISPTLNWHAFCILSGSASAGSDSPTTTSRLPEMDGIEILTRLALILRRMERLAGLDPTDKEDLRETVDELKRLREKWQELTQELRRSRDLPDDYFVDPSVSENSGHATE